MAFDFDIEYVKGNAIPHVHALSRLYFKRVKNRNMRKYERWIFALGRKLTFYPINHYRIQYKVKLYLEQKIVNGVIVQKLKGYTKKIRQKMVLYIMEI